jgi:hypothetical protein
MHTGFEDDAMVRARISVLHISICMPIKKTAGNESELIDYKRFPVVEWLDRFAILNLKAHENLLAHDIS